MKYNTDFIIIPTICVGLYSLYNLYKLNKKIEVLDNGINLIMSTHLLYMENRDEQTEQIKSINNILEQIALSSPFRGVGWQTKFIEEKIRRDLEDTKFYDDEAGV